MSRFFYTFSIYLLASVYSIARYFNPKARQFVVGRKKLFTKLSQEFVDKSKRWVWVHCASLGEFEQGRPVMEALKEQFPEIKILLTFFSPSGYENKKDYDGADAIFYLPWDTPTNAKKFVSIVNPVLALFIKYEFWYNYSKQLKNKSVPTVSVSCILRPDQAFFKWYGGIFRQTLKNFDHFFVQNRETAALLGRLNLSCTLVGDTRFDRVVQIATSNAENDIARKFKGQQKLLVAGSCWPEDMEVLYPTINLNSHELKFIIAPHEPSENFISKIEASISAKTVRYSKAVGDLSHYSVLIVDNVGLLSQLYRYGEFAYVGGAFGAGLHNILEAACYGIPIFFGDKNYHKFQEANDLIMRGGAFEVGSYTELKHAYEMLHNYPNNFLLACEVTRSYVVENLGATGKIVRYCSAVLKNK